MLGGKLFGVILGFVLATTLFGGVALAHKIGDRSFPGIWGHRMKRLAAYLRVTDSQRSKIRVIVTEARPKIKAVWQDTAKTDSEKIAMVREIRGGERSKAGAVLSADQLKKLSDLKGKMKKAWEEATQPAVKKP